MPSRTISLAIRSDYIHQVKMNAVVAAIRRIIPGPMLEDVIRKGPLTL